MSLSGAPQHHERLERLGAFVWVVLLAVSLWCLVPVESYQIVPVNPHFRYDGRTSDLSQHYYHLHRSGVGARVPQLLFTEAQVPDDVLQLIRHYGVRWDALPSLLQRALLWDFGYAMTTNSVNGLNVTALVKIYTLQGRSMAEIHVSKRAYERIGCVPQVCTMPTGEIFYRSRWCDGDQVERFSLCASEPAAERQHSSMWAEGATADYIPETNVLYHFWDDYGGTKRYLVYAIHTQPEETPWNQCPTGFGAPIIPCVDYNSAVDKSVWQRPIRGKIATVWLSNFAETHQPPYAWLVLAGIIGSLALVLSIVVGTKTYKRYKAARQARERTMNESLLSSEQHGSSNDETTTEGTSDPDEGLEIEDLDVMAKKHFESIIGLGSWAPTRGSNVHDRRSSVQYTTEVTARCRRSTLVHTPTGTGPIACCTFHLFESHRQIRKKRVAIRDIKFIRALSHGNTGQVWLATMRGRQVAVKQLLENKRRVLKEMEMFMAEIYLVAQLHHPNIVGLVGVAWSTLEQVLMVQEFMARGDLLAFLQVRRKRDEKQPPVSDANAAITSDWSNDFTWQGQKLYIAQDVAGALAYLHNFSPQIVHRDIKSKNVLLSDAMEVKICDFGICRRGRNEEENGSNLTVTEAAGTMSWTAPEVLLSNIYDEKVDIYSFGVLLSEIDSCLLPYHDPENLTTRLIFHPLRLMKHIAQGNRPKLTPQCPPKIRAVIEACWAGNPNDRPTAAKVVEMLDADDIV